VARILLFKARWAGVRNGEALMKMAGDSRDIPETMLGTCDLRRRQSYAHSPHPETGRGSHSGILG
jgi:hypothetical protein